VKGEREREREREGRGRGRGKGRGRGEESVGVREELMYPVLPPSSPSYPPH